MPYKRKSNTTPYRRRRVHYPRRRVRKNRSGKTGVGIQRTIQAQDAQLVRLRYSDNQTFVSTTIPIQQVFRGNSLQDPDFTGAGHQPRSFDQWSALYAAYIVTGAAITITATVTSGVAFVWVVASNLSIPGTPTADDLSEFKYMKRTAVTLAHPAKLSMYVSTRQMFGLPKGITQYDSSFRAATAANPASTWFWRIFAQDPDEATSQTVIIRSTITYYTKFFQRIVTVGS